jgi:hypothetical protein
MKKQRFKVFTAVKVQMLAFCGLRLVILEELTDVSEKYVAPIFRLEMKKQKKI